MRAQALRVSGSGCWCTHRAVPRNHRCCHWCPCHGVPRNHRCCHWCPCHGVPRNHGCCHWRSRCALSPSHRQFWIFHFLNFPLRVPILILLSCCSNSSSLFPVASLCTFLHRGNTSFEVWYLQPFELPTTVALSFCVLFLCTHPSFFMSNNEVVVLSSMFTGFTPFECHLSIGCRCRHRHLPSLLLDFRQTLLHFLHLLPGLLLLPPFRHCMASICVLLLFTPKLCFLFFLLHVTAYSM